MSSPNLKSASLPVKRPLTYHLAQCGVAGYVPAVILHLSPKAASIPLFNNADKIGLEPGTLAHEIRASIVAGAKIFLLTSDGGPDDMALAVRANKFLESLMDWIISNGAVIVWQFHVTVNDPILLSRFDGSSLDGSPTAFDKIAGRCVALGAVVDLGDLKEAKEYHWQPLQAVRKAALALSIPASIYASGTTEEELATLAAITRVADIGPNLIVQMPKEFNATLFYATVNSCNSYGWRVQ